jgi:hypothetical protein
MVSIFWLVLIPYQNGGFVSNQKPRSFLSFLTEIEDIPGLRLMKRAQAFGNQRLQGLLLGAGKSSYDAPFEIFKYLHPTPLQRRLEIPI